jgi:hypothetical protein
MGLAEYHALANLHRPGNPEQLRAEALRLAAAGLKPVDIATALRLDLAAVRTWLAKPQP